MFPVLSANGPSGYNINNSLRFRASASARLSRTFGSATNYKIQTFSAWVKRGLLSSSTTYRLMGGYNGSAANSTEINFNNDTLRVEFGGAANNALITTQVFRDPSAWYHIVIAIDTTQATAANRVKMYVNGTQVTAFGTANYPAQNADSQLTSANANNSIGAGWSGFEYFDGYMADINFIDGQALTPSSFGSTNATTGVWQPARYTGTYGTNGFYLNFSDIAQTVSSNVGLGKDFSGNTNYWVTNNINLNTPINTNTSYDAMLDSPTLTSATVANYAVLNPVFGSTNVTLSEANLKAQVGSTGGVYRTAAATFGVSSGKWYWELVFGNPTTGNPLAGVGDMTVATSTWNADTSTNANFWYVDASNGNKINGTGGPGSSYGSSFSTTDICMVALDMDNGKIWWGKNGTWFASGDPAAGTNAAYTNLANKLLTIALMGGCGSCGFSGNLYQLNFGQRPFTYTPPTGFVRLNTYNLPDSTIKKGNNSFGVLTYTGNGSTSATRSDTSLVNFTPDFVWIKERSGTDYHNLFDINRVVSGDYRRIYSNDTTAEESSTYFGTTNLNGFVNGGFTTGSGGNTNTNGDTYVAWCWDANGSPVSNTSGTITSNVSANATAGFSVVTYTGTGSNATVGHGLGVAPKMIIVKNRTTAGGNGIWRVYHTSLGGTKYINLNETTAATTGSTVWNNTDPTSSVFSVGITGSVNDSGNNYVAYCWAEIAGFSKFGSYTGNGSTDGSFIFTGFRPKFIMVKRTDAVEGWQMFDTSINTYNSANILLEANLSNAEANSSGNAIDILSNGFKQRNTRAATNASGGTYIYMAFAENPFKNSNAR
jgi:hypothetical protein